MAISPVLGVVLAPVTGEFAWAERGGGAWMRRGDEALRSCRTRALGQTRRWSPAAARTAIRACSDMLGASASYESLPLGSSLKFCASRPAEADSILRLGPTSEWDTAAAQCVLEEAGGAVLDLQGRPLRYNRKDSLLNPEFIACGDPDQDWARLLGTAPAS